MSMTSAEPIAPAPSQSPEPPFGINPLGPVLELGERAVKIGVILGILGALLVHGAVGVKAAETLGQVHAFAVLVQAHIRERLHSQIDIDVTEPPPPPPPPEPPPEPKEIPTTAPAAPPPPGTPPPAPAAAEAGKVLTADPDPNEPVDLTGDGFVSGNGDRFAGGITASDGKSTHAVRDLRAKPEGVGKAPPGPVSSAAGSNLSRAAMPMGGAWNDCGFPAEADIEGIDNAVVSLTVTVGPDGRAKSVTILKDPGNGFGQATRACAFRKQFAPALDLAGNPMTMSTAPFNVRFTR
ncbi:MAG TPA: energy transducer TonB [Polyangiaceae bacterium]|jgi:protein TonB|nr:energy transducer TonB [Polyangiaceae bacterium]